MKKEISLLEKIKMIDDTKKIFEKQLEKRLSLTKVGSPLFVRKDSGLQDDLSAVETAVGFKRDDEHFEIVHSLAKWKDISNKLANFYNQYSSYDNCVYKDNKKEFEEKLNNVIQGIWDNLTSKVDDDILKRVLMSNYNNITEDLITEFMNGIKLICTMYLNKETICKKIDKKNCKVTRYSWNSNNLSRYNIRTDKQFKI